MDIAGPYSCFICGFGFTSAAVSYSLNPIVMGLLVTDHVSIEFFFPINSIGKRL